MKTRPLTRVCGALLGAFAVAFLFAAPAAAHDGKPVITVDQAHPSPTSTHYIVKMVYDDDNDPIIDASLTAVPISPSGAEGALVTMESLGDGTYQGAVPMAEPGTWKVRFTTVDPNGSMEHTQVVAGDATTTTTAAPTTTTAPPETTAPPTTAAPDTEETAAGSDDDDSGSAVPLVVGGLVLLAAAGGGAAWAMNRNKPDPATPADTPDVDE